MKTVFCCCANVLVWISIVCIILIGKGQGISATPIERQLEKFATRVGRNEYVSVFKEPGGGGENEKKSMTYVLLSKLYVLPNDGNLDGVTNEVSYPEVPESVKFRRTYVSPQPQAPTPTEDKILFPKEDTTTMKTLKYNSKPFPSTEISPRKQFSPFGDFTPKSAIPIISPWNGSEFVRRLTKFEETPVLSLSDKQNKRPMIMDDREQLGWYTLLTVPTRTNKVSDGCPYGHHKDHHGNCRPVFNFRPPTSPVPVPVPVPVVAVEVTTTQASPPPTTTYFFNKSSELIFQ